MVSCALSVSMPTVVSLCSDISPSLSGLVFTVPSLPVQVQQAQALLLPGGVGGHQGDGGE